MGLLNAPTSIVGGVLDPIAAKIKNPFSADVSKGGYVGPDFPDGFQLVEVVNGLPNEAGKLVLRGSMLPEIPFKFGGTQKLVKEYYPGNPEPTTQVLGGRESDLVIKGRLKAKRYKDGSYRKAPEAMQHALDALRLKGNLLRLSLGEWQRYGFLEEVSFEMNTLADIHYELKFSIVGFRIPSNNKFHLKEKSLPIDVNRELLAAADAYMKTYSAVPASMPKSLADVLNGAISDVASAINLVTGFVDTVMTTAEDVVASANRAIGLVKNAKANVSRFRRRVGSLPLVMGSLAKESSPSAQFRSAYANNAHIVRAMAATTSLSALLARLQTQFELIAKTTPLARYRVIEGDSLQRISVRFYKTADHWKKIYDHNKLSTTELVVGRVLEIPRL